MTPQLIYLIGYMGAGKTTLGSAVAHATAARFIDLDDYIEAREGITISEIFRLRGETEFRRLETEALATLSREVAAPGQPPFSGAETSTSRPLIIACGGGTPCHNGNMDLMNATGTTIYLEASPDTLVRRLSAERSRRPLVASMTPEQLPAFIAAALADRLPHYTRAAHRFCADNLDSIPEITRSVDAFIARFLPTSPIPNQ